MALLGDIRHYPRRASSPASVTSYLPQHSQIEILLSLPDVRIVEFKPPGLDSKFVCTKEYTSREVESGTLPWSSRFERTVAVGSLRIYRAPESIAFLNCQNAIRPILPKSQAWCVDGGSKFVLGSPTLFWRIEVPRISRDEEKRVEELKRVFDQILRYEKTPCPFRRQIKGEIIPTPKPSIKQDSQSPIDSSREFNDLHSFEGLQNYAFENRFSKSKIFTPISSPRFKVHQDSFEPSEKVSISVLNSNYPQTPNSTDQSAVNNFRYQSYKEQTYGSNLATDSSKKNFSLFAEQKSEKRRCYSASHNARQSSTQQSLHFSGILNTLEHGESTPDDFLGDQSDPEDSSSSSFQSLQSCHSSQNLSLTMSETSSESSIPNHSNSYDNSFQSAHRDKERSASESFTATKSQESNHLFFSGFEIDHKELSENLRNAEFSDEVKKSDEDIFDAPRIVLPDFSSQLRRRRPLDSAHFSSSNSLNPDLSNKMLHLAHQVPKEIVRKTSEIFITPSNNLIQLMLGIASRIVSGEWRGVFSNFGEPVHWDFEDDSDDDWLDSEYRNSNRVKMTDVKVSGCWDFD